MVVTADSVQMDPQALSRVEELFWEQMEKGLHPGAALAVYRHGQVVLDLWGGTADQESGRPVTPDTMFVLYSSTKPLAASCLHILWQRGKLDWDDPVARYWPEFAQNGKDSVTIRHILTHQGGFPETPTELTWDKWRDWEAVVQAIERITPLYKPGSVIAYHPRNYGWVIGELVRRIDGRPINQFLQEELTGPLGMNDTYVGLPSELNGRVSRIHAMEDCDRPEMVSTYNKPGVYQAVQPAGGGIATARDLARFYAMMAGGGTLDGVQVFKPETVREVTRLQVEGTDRSLGHYVRRALGPVLGDPRMGSSATEDLHTFGHGGAGTSLGWSDPDSGLAVAYITNGFRANESNNPRLAAISQAVRDACR
jgi:CubicO group peptidase (beta-lactamase class C family)